MVIATTDLVLPSGQRIELDPAANLVRLVPSLRTGEVASFLAPLGLRLRSTMDGLPHDWRPLLGDERHAQVQRVLDRADPHRVFARLPGV